LRSRQAARERSGPCLTQETGEHTVAKIPPGVGPRFPQVVVLFGATGDLARRKLLPGLYHLATAGFIPGCRIIGVSLDDSTRTRFRTWLASRSTSSSTAR
jgi:hypothetical protein